MRKFQKATAVIMAAALAATGCSAGGAKTGDPQQPSGTEAAKTEAAAGADKTEAAKDAASGEEEPVLVVYTARSEALNNAVIPEFEKDTGIKVEVVVAGTGELLKRAQSEKDNPLGDIFWVADQTMLSSSRELFMEYVSPEDENMLDAFRNTTGYFTPAFADPTVMIVNKDLKGDMRIDGFEDLLNPELKGKIAFGDPVNSSSVPVPAGHALRHGQGRRPVIQRGMDLCGPVHRKPGRQDGQQLQPGIQGRCGRRVCGGPDLGRPCCQLCEGRRRG